MIGSRTRRLRRGDGERGGRDRAARARQRGFTLLEVMISLAILVVGLLGILGRVAGNIQVTQDLTLRGTAVDLARGKMYDIEETLLKDGFQDLDQSEDGDFGDEGYPNIEWEAKVEKVEMPGLGAMQALEDGQEAAESGGGGLEESPIAAFMGGLGGGGEGLDQGASLITGYFEMLTKALEVSIRKVTLTVTWKVGRSEEKLVVACYFTDPNGPTKALGGLPALPTAGGSGDEDSGGVGSGGTRGGGPIRGGFGRGGTSGGSGGFGRGDK